MSAATTETRVYWQPGCTSCLRVKEFLSRRGVPFISRNVLESEEAYGELQALGLRRVPIVARGGAWADGQVLADVARLVGIEMAATRQLPPAELMRRLLAIIDGVARFVGQIGEAELETELPGRPRSLMQLSYHLLNVADAFIEHEEGVPLTFASYNREPKRGAMRRSELLDYHAKVRGRLAAWWDRAGGQADWRRRADVYYGEQSLHDFLERTTWHAGQHARQLMWMMETRLGIQPREPLGPELFADLPMPESIWDPA